MLYILKKKDAEGQSDIHENLKPRASNIYGNICVHIYIYLYLYYIIEASLEVKLPTIWTDETQRRDGKSQKREEIREEKQKENQRKESQKKEDPGARKGRKAAKHCVFFQGFVAPEGRKIGSLKRRVRSHLAR